MKEVEERFVCSTSICYLLVCARVVEKCGQYEGDGGKVVFSISTIHSLSPSVCTSMVVECGQGCESRRQTISSLSIPRFR
jgi:hypothetical protein